MCMDKDLAYTHVHTNIHMCTHVYTHAYFDQENLVERSSR